VDLDHQDWLGDDRETIGFEKAGIARAWKPLVLGDDDPPASVLRHAYAIGASAVRIGCDFFFEPLDAARWRWREVGFDIELPVPALAAPVQLRNAAVAIAALRALDIELVEAAIERGVAGARLAGRLQRFDRAGVAVSVDVGHNPQAARELAAWLRATPVAGRTHAVYAALADKDAAAVVAAFDGLVDAWWLGGSLGAGARGIDVATLAARLRGSVAQSGQQWPDPAAALVAALQAAAPGDRILLFGSFHAAEEALHVLRGPGSEARVPRSV